MAIEFYAPYDVDEHDHSPNAATGTVGAQASLNKSVYCQGTGSYSFTGDGDELSNAVTYPWSANYTPGASVPFIIQGRFMIDDLAETIQGLISLYSSETPLNQRAFYIVKRDDELQCFFSDDGTLTSPAIVITGTAVVEVNTWYHVAASRDSSDEVRLFFNGTEIGTSATFSAAVHSNSQSGPLTLGAFDSEPSTPFPKGFPLSGYLDDWSITTGDFYDSDFTPPACVSRFAGGLGRTYTDNYEPMTLPKLKEIHAKVQSDLLKATNRPKLSKGKRRKKK